ncbi:unnamed protein product [Camellia sinensis]
MRVDKDIGETKDMGETNEGFKRTLGKLREIGETNEGFKRTLGKLRCSCSAQQEVMINARSCHNSRRRMVEGYLKCFEKELSKTDATGNLEIPGSALYLPAVAENTEIMYVWDHGKIWKFKAPVRSDGTGRRFMSHQWRQFSKDNSLMDRDVVKLYRSTTIVNLYVVTFERALRALPLFPGAPL